MLNIIFEGDWKMNGLRNIIQDISPEETKLLDDLAKDTRMKMSQEAPKGLYGLLASEIDISSPTQNQRVIEPTARNVKPGNRYALPIEKGWGTTGAFPNVESVAAYFGATGNMKLAFAIAAGIAKKTYKPNPFVARTFSWVQSRINSMANTFLGRITARYVAGGY